MIRGRVLCLLVTASLLGPLAGCESAKSSNPLSPSVAGPLPNVQITAPRSVEPAVGTSITSDTQPLTLIVENATTNGQRPLTYTFEVTTDAGFTNMVLTRENIAPGNGRTSLRLPDPLESGRTYYWRARAVDGANTGEWGVSHFMLVTLTEPPPAPPTPTPPTPTPPTPTPPKPTPPTPAPPTPAPPTPPSGGGVDELDLSTVTFLHTNVSKWRITSRVTSVTIKDPPICIAHTMSGRWPVVDGGEGNPWVIANIGGRWYAATYEWLRPGQTCKEIDRDTIGPHTKARPLDTWRPRSGEIVGFMVSALARTGQQSVAERSNVVLVRWP